MKIVTLPVEPRPTLGSAESRRLRRAGRLPVNLYGMNREPANLSVDRHSFALSFERGNRMFELALNDTTQVCLLKDIQYDALGDTLLHADLWRIDDSMPVTIRVALEFVGVPTPVSGAVTDYVTRDIQINCVPRNIPGHIEVNISKLEVGDRIDAKDLSLPEGASLVGAPETCIVSFHYLHGTGEDGADGAEGADEAGNEPEVIGEKKDDDG